LDSPNLSVYDPVKNLLNRVSFGYIHDAYYAAPTDNGCKGLLNFMNHASSSFGMLGNLWLTRRDDIIVKFNLPSM
jgi:hypothetical protein